ncbi:MAG: hypothetical protein Q7V58_04785 [Actinomycetota bacterium]|nr:hypothetical protein [Actinomycetota bacterium]
MTASTTSVPVRAENPSVDAYLRAALSPEQRRNVLFPSFTQWDFALAALADTAACLREQGAEITLAFWGPHTPLRDPGWSASRALGRLTGAPTCDDIARAALLAVGIPAAADTRPPIRRWRPGQDIRIDAPMNRTQIRALQYHGTPMGRAILQVHPDTETPITDTFFWSRRWVQAAARSYAWVFDQVSAVIAQRDVTAVCVYNGRFLHDRAASAAAQVAGVPVLYYDTGGLDTDFDLTDSVTHDWSDLQRRMLALYEGWAPEDRDVVGGSWFRERLEHAAPDNALFTEAQERGSTIDRPDADCLVVYFSSSGDEIAELELDWGQFIGSQPEALAYLAEECRSRPGYTLVVRSHPHMRMKPAQDLAEWLEAVGQAQPDVHLDPYSTVDSYALMRQADIVVTYGSTTGVEAAYAHKPVIVMGPSAYDELGCAIRASTREQLAAALDVREPGSWPGAVSYGLMMRRRGFLLSRVRRSAGTFELAGKTFAQPRLPVRHAGNLVKRIQRWYLSR